MKAKLRMDILGEKPIKEGSIVEVNFCSWTGLRLFRAAYEEVIIKEDGKEEVKVSTFYMTADEYKIVLEEVK